MGPVPDHADVVAKRRDVLEVLSTPMTKPELVTALSVSRSTVDRAIEDLLDLDFVTRQGSEYEVTYAGRQALSAYDSFVARLDSLADAQPVLGALTPSVDIDPAVLEGATVVQSSTAAPEAPVDANVETIEGADRFRGTGPAVIPRYIEVVTSLVESGTETELVLTAAVVDALSETYPDGLSTLSSQAGLDLYVTEKSRSYAVWTAEKPARTVSGIVVYGDNGIVGVVNNDTPAMNEWVREEYERLKRDADPLD